MEFDTDVDDDPVRPRRRRAIVGVVATATMAALAVGAAAPLLLHRRANEAPRPAGWTRSADGRALLVAVAWGPPSQACSDVYLRDLDDPARTTLRVWRSCGVTDATARFDGDGRVVIGSAAAPDAALVSGFDLGPLRAAPVLCTTRCDDDTGTEAVAEAFDPPARRGGTA